MELSDRKKKILRAIVDLYIRTAEPVASKTIAQMPDMDFSSATIRNEMAELTTLGYLEQPHTSAGRIPSYKAYRLYVDQMIHPMPLSREESTFIKSCFDHRIGQVEELSARIAKALSSMTHYTTAVLTRAPQEDQMLSHLQLVPISDRRLLLVLVTKSGAVRQSVLDLDKPIAPDALYTVSQIISRELEGCAMNQLPAMLTRLAGGQEGEMRELLGLLAAQPPEKDGGVGSLVVGGRSNLLSFPEYADVDRAKELLSVLETREKVVSLLSHQGEMEISVRIGPETGMEETKDCSIVTASYRLNDGTVNTIGLIGPTRMQYGKVLSVLGEVGRSITELLDGQNENHEKQEEQEK